MRIATWNINGLRARLDFILAWLEEREPDLVGLQELKMTEEQFPVDAFEQAGYQVAAHGQKAWNGVAVLSRKPTEVLQRGLPGQDDFGSRLITVRQDEWSFTTVYCPNGKNLEHDDFPRKLSWFDSLHEHFAKNHDPKGLEVLCGDFNICPTPLDSWSEERHAGDIFHTAEERQRMEDLYAWGFLDLYRVRHPDEKAFSWWDYRGGAFHRGHGLRIDFLLGTQAVEKRVRSVTIDRDWRKKRGELKASDHCPVIADLD